MERDLDHARAVMTQEVQRSAEEQQRNVAQVNVLRELRKMAEHKLQAVTNELSQVREEFVVQLDSLQKDNERLQGLVEEQSLLRAQACNRISDVTKERVVLERNVTDLKEVAMYH